MTDARTMRARFRVALDLCEFAERMVRQRARRARPTASEAEIETDVRAWYFRRPGAPRGDGAGRALTWPDRRPIE